MQVRSFFKNLKQQSGLQHSHKKQKDSVEGSLV